jgi:hypothetical protein
MLSKGVKNCSLLECMVEIHTIVHVCDSSAPSRGMICSICTTNIEMKVYLHISLIFKCVLFCLSSYIDLQPQAFVTALQFYLC